MRTELLFKGEARDRIMRGVNKLAKAVSTTLGGAGKNVMMVDNLLPPRVTKDGITVANSITLDDFVEQAGLEIVRQASARSAKEVGDGTTTATVLASEILNQGVAVIDDVNVHDFKKGMEKAYEDISEVLQEITIEVADDFNALVNIATLSANGDKEIGTTVATLIKELDNIDAQIVLSEDKTKQRGVYHTIKQGYSFPKGCNPFFETKPGTKTVVFEEAKIMLVDRYIARISQLEEVIDYCHQNGVPLVVLYSNIDSKALENMILAKMEMGLKLCAVEFPDTAELQQYSIMDISSATGAKIIKDLEQYDVEEDLGEVAQFKSDGYNTTIVFKEDFKEAVNEIVLNIREGIDKLEGYKLSDDKERLKRLSKGVGEIRIGSATNVEYQEIYDRVEDAIGAVRSAIEEGVVIGGGYALLRASFIVRYNKPTENDSFNKGYDVVANACHKPFLQILENAGIKEEDLPELKENEGYNVRTKRVENFIDVGIIDPKKVTRSALLAAVSVASSILTTDCIVYPKLIGGSGGE